MKVKLIKQYDAEGNKNSLTLNRIYEVLGIEAGFYRILNDAGYLPYGNDPVLFDPTCFVIEDTQEPDFWITEYDDGVRYSYPQVWLEYFFEDYHDGKETTVRLFKKHLKHYYPWTWNERYMDRKNE